MSEIVKCKRCNGVGLIRRDTCGTCKGSGRVKVIEGPHGKTVVPAPQERP
jgi:DnaJ-class molecular chaperone